MRDVGNHVPKLALGFDRDAPKWVLEQTAGALVGFVDRLGVGVEEIRESVTHVIFRP